MDDEDGRKGRDNPIYEMAMNLSDEQCETLVDLNKNKPQNMYQSKFKGQYFLVDVEWKPLTHDERQGALL